MRELRHDFRRLYHTSYDEVPTAEAIDLIRTLPDGSSYVRATDFARSWGVERHRHADLLDAVRELTWAMAMDHERMPEPPRVVRPSDVVSRVETIRRATAARHELEHGSWEDV